MVETLKPVEVSEFYIKQITSGLTKYLWENLYKDFFKILDNNSVYNAKGALEAAITSGRVYYERGAFRSKKNFSNAIAKELEQIGAVFKYGAYYIDRMRLPVQIESALGIVAAREAAAFAAINQTFFKLAESLGKTPVDLFIEKAVEKTFKKLEADITKSAEERKIPTIEFIPTDKEAEKIAKDYTHNMQYWVSKWEEKEIIKMRQDVLKMVSDGARVPTIKEYFQKRWKIAENKAEFLAVNESHLAGSVIKATRYQNMGFTHFKWGRSSSREKRKLHEEYYGKVFAYDDPPVIDEKLNQKGLPRQIWNCKCHSQPVVNRSFFENSRKIENAKRNIFTKIAYKITNSKQRNNNPWRYRRFGEGEEV